MCRHVSWRPERDWKGKRRGQAPLSRHQNTFEHGTNLGDINTPDSFTSYETFRFPKTKNCICQLKSVRIVVQGARSVRRTCRFACPKNPGLLSCETIQITSTSPEIPEI